MSVKKYKKQEAIFFIITSFNQLYNFLSYFQENKLIKNKKIYFTIFSDLIPNELILEIKKYIEKFAPVEILDMRRKNIPNILNINILKIFFYYFFILRKIFQLKKVLNISYILVSGRMQIPILFLMYFFSSSKIFFAEDGIGEYVPYANSEKKPIFFLLLKKFLKKNSFRINILQLAESRKNYLRILDQKFLNDDSYINNVELYKNFLNNNSEIKYSLKPKCIVIGTLPPINSNINIFQDLYVNTMIEINKRYSYHPDQILFFPHPRMKQHHFEELSKNLSNFAKVQTPSSLIVENYLLVEDVDLVVGSLSTALYYAKKIFGKNNVFYLYHGKSLEKKDKEKNFLNAFEEAGIKNFFN